MEPVEPVERLGILRSLELAVDLVFLDRVVLAVRLDSLAAVERRDLADRAVLLAGLEGQGGLDTVANQGHLAFLVSLVQVVRQARVDLAAYLVRAVLLDDLGPAARLDILLSAGYLDSVDSLVSLDPAEPAVLLHFLGRAVHQDILVRQGIRLTQEPAGRQVSLHFQEQAEHLGIRLTQESVERLAIQHFLEPAARLDTVG